MKIIIKDYHHNLEVTEVNTKIIKEYKNLGVIRKFETKRFYEEEYEETLFF